MPSTPVRLLSIRLSLCTLLLCGALSISAQGESEKTRTELEATMASLGEAWDRGDRDAVLSHFQHGDLIPPDDREWRILGHFRFWEKPIRSIETGKDGVIRVEFTMDPESASPAQFMTLEFVRSDGGSLVVRSDATAEELEAARVANKKSQERMKREAEMFESLERELKGRVPAGDEWPLVEHLVAAFAEKTGAPRSALPFHPLAEVVGEDDALLLCVIAEHGRLQDPAAVPFRREGDRWVVDEEAMRPGSGLEPPERLAEVDQPGPNLRRQTPGLELERIPLFLHYAFSNLRAAYGRALAEEDWEGATTILRETLVGFTLVDRGKEAIRFLETRPRKVDSVAIDEQRIDGDEAVVTFAIAEESGTSIERFRLRRAGDGWVIGARSDTLALATMGMLRSLGDTIEAWKIDHDGLYPDARNVDDLRAALVKDGFYRNPPVADAWGTGLKYLVSDDRTGFRLVSAGGDRAFEPAQWEAEGDLPDLDHDIVFENGTLKSEWIVTDERAR